jgi:hypothetical protein
VYNETPQLPSLQIIFHLLNHYKRKVGEEVAQRSSSFNPQERSLINIMHWEKKIQWTCMGKRKWKKWWI